MLKQTIEFEDLDGNPVSEDFYFNLTKADLIDLEADYSTYGGLTEAMEALLDQKDASGLMAIMKRLVRTSYGVKGLDGRQFIRSTEKTEEFVNTDAYSELITKLVQDSDFASRFIVGILPNSLMKQARETGVITEVDGKIEIRDVREQAQQALTPPPFPPAE